jgi:ABC-type sugar transport system ATPase subunit
MSTSTFDIDNNVDVDIVSKCGAGGRTLREELAMARLTLQDIRKSYGAVEVIKGLNLDVADGEFIVFVGPSGCGKSTLLRMIAGLESITHGDLVLDGRAMTTASPFERGIAMVFQNYALYPHMTVAQNLSYGLRVAGAAREEIALRVREVAKSLQIGHLLDRLPKALSGGQRQRVAIGRAIVREPKIFLFDEPLSNLDAALRVQTRIEIARLQQRLKSTTVYVTHDQTEAMTLADRIVVLNGGRIEQVGTPLELYREPQNMFVAGFIGSPRMNFLKMRAHGSDAGTQVRTAGTSVALPFELAGEADLILGVRPEDLTLTPDGSGPLAFRLDIEEHMGEFRLLYLTADDGSPVIAKTTLQDSFAEGDVLHFTFEPATAHLFDAHERRLSNLHHKIAA